MNFNDRLQGTCTGLCSCFRKVALVKFLIHSTTARNICDVSVALMSRNNHCICIPSSSFTHVIFVCVRLLSWYNCAKQYGIAENDSIALAYQSVVRCSM